jgi:hypothetical protein
MKKHLLFTLCVLMLADAFASLLVISDCKTNAELAFVIFNLCASGFIALLSAIQFEKP